MFLFFTLSISFFKRFGFIWFMGVVISISNISFNHFSLQNFNISKKFNKLFLIKKFRKNLFKNFKNYLIFSVNELLKKVISLVNSSFYNSNKVFLLLTKTKSFSKCYISFLSSNSIILYLFK